VAITPKKIVNRIPCFADAGHFYSEIDRDMLLSLSTPAASIGWKREHLLASEVLKIVAMNVGEAPCEDSRTRSTDNENAPRRTPHEVSAADICRFLDSQYCEYRLAIITSYVLLRTLVTQRSYMSAGFSLPPISMWRRGVPGVQI
jgi:hypothetical protein